MRRRAWQRAHPVEGRVVTSPRSLTKVLSTAAPEVGAALERRVSALLCALTGSPHSAASLRLDDLEAAMERAGPDSIWLSLAVLAGQLPDARSVLRTVRVARLDGPLMALGEAMGECGQLESGSWPDVEVVTGCVLVDVHHTSRTELVTGIQRVARETVSRWNRDHVPTLVGWTSDYRGLRRLSQREVDVVLNGPKTPVDLTDAPIPDEPEVRPTPPLEPVLVPWRCTVLIPELAAEPERADRYQALARYSGSRTGVIGFDCVPLMASETSAEGMTAAFARHLAAAAHFDRIAAISDSAGIEYNGWRSMLSGSGRTGPEIRSIPLTVEPRRSGEAAIEAARELVAIGSLPVVLAVGSHEPRKNHLAVLQAAETLWREGMRFSLTFVGGNSWKSAAFVAQVRTLQAAHRPVQTILGLSDELLWASYRIAYCTVFVSVHEGFGLPLAESLASGTPAVTSNFGSMLEIAGRGGTITVDPADDDAIADALRRLLQSRALRDQMASEAARLNWRTWDDYARETWEFLAEGA